MKTRALWIVLAFAAAAAGLISTSIPGHAQTQLSCPAVAPGTYISANHTTCGVSFQSGAALFVDNTGSQVSVGLSYTATAAAGGDELWVVCNGPGCERDGVRLSTAYCNAPSGGGACNISFVTPMYESSFTHEAILAILSGSFSVANNATTVPSFNINVAAPPPRLRSASPYRISELGGTTVTLHGYNFTGATSVTIGGTPATNLVVTSANSVTVTAPPQPPGTATVSITTPHGSHQIAGLLEYVDATPPVLTEVTPVPTPAGDRTPAYTFNTTEAGSIGYEGACRSAITTAVAGDNTIEFEPLSAGTYDDCKIVVTDNLGNASPVLAVTSFTILETAANILVTSGDNQTATVLSDFPQTLTVTITDVGGAPVQEVAVTFTAPSGGPTASLSTTSVKTDENGQAFVSVKANGRIGSYQITANAAGLPPAHFNLTNEIGPPAKIIATSGARQFAPINTAFRKKLVTTIRDIADNPIPGVEVTFSSFRFGAFADLSANAVTTDANGQAAVEATANGVTGRYNIGAHIVIGRTPVVLNFPLTNTDGPMLAFRGDKQLYTTVGEPFNRQLAVRVSGSYGQGLPNVTVSFTAPTTGPSASLSAQSVVTDAHGRAAVSATANSLSGGYDVIAKAQGVGELTFKLRNNRGDASQIALISGTPQSIQINDRSEGLRVMVTDAFGNPVSGERVTFSMPDPSVGPSAKIDGGLLTTSPQGAAFAIVKANSHVGSYQVTASIEGASEVAQFNLTNIAGTPDTLSVVSGTPQTAIIGETFGTPLKIKITDGSGNPVPNIAVTFATPRSGASASLSANNVTTNANGEASVEATANQEPGSYLATASASGLDAVQFALTNGRDAKADIRETKRVIRNFMVRRADQLVSSDPDLVGRLSGGASNAGTVPFGFTGSGAEGSTTVGFSFSLRQAIAAQNKAKAQRRMATTENGDAANLGLAYGPSQPLGQTAPTQALGFDFWAQGKWAHVDTAGTNSDISFFYAGVDYRFSPDLLVGVLGQFDWVDQKTDAANGNADGHGWMMGPYAVWRVHQNLILDGRAAWGQSSNSINALGLGYDDFNTDRWLVRGNVTGDFKHGNWHIAPSAGVVYFREQQHGYRDLLGNFISSQTIALGRLSFGPKITYPHKARDGSVLAPHLSIKGLWDFESTQALAASGPAAESTPDLRARVEGGLSVSHDRLTISGEAFYDGIGAEDFEAFGGRIGVRLSFN